MKFYRWLMLLVPVVSLFGCSSISNTSKSYENYSFASCKAETDLNCTCHSKDPNNCYSINSHVYGGTKEDLALAAAPIAFFNAKSNESLWLLPIVLVVWPVAVVDLPFSAVSDTILLPLHKHLDDKVIERQSSK